MLAGDLFDPFKQVMTHLAVKKDHVVTDNWVFFLHRKWSFIFCLIALIIIVSQPVIIEYPLPCLGPKEKEISSTFVQEYCWTHGTYLILERLDGKIGKDIAHPGIGSDTFSDPYDRHGVVNGTKIFYGQYIFYPIIILIQFCMFRGSKYLWKYMEGNRLQNVLSELTTGIVDAEIMKKRLNMITDYMTSSMTFHTSYAYKYVFCELYNGFSVVMQFWMVDYFFNHEFLNYGWDVVRFMRRVNDGTAGKMEMLDPFVKVFPKVTKCSLVVTGASGNLVPHEAICVMPLNNVAEKIFFFMWFWLVGLGILTLLGLMYRAIVLYSPMMRYIVLKFKVRLVSTRCYFDIVRLKYVVKNSTYGDWFVLSLMQKNLDVWVFSRLVDELYEKMEETRGKEL